MPDSIPILEAPPGPAWTYRAVVRRVIDGDTIVVTVDVGFGIEHTDSIRLLHINAPEMVGESRAEGYAARAALETLIPENHTVLIQTVRDKREKYGRLLANVWTAQDLYVNGAMVASGNALPYEGGKR